jgi:ferrous iron transport protein B
MIRIALVGQPNCGKSTLFNSVAGYTTVVSNFPGSTLDLISSRVHLNGQHFLLIDIPGLYSLTSPEPDEEAYVEYLLQGNADVIVNILDASILSRSLELTLELLELQIPLVLCLNMLDEAQRKGIEIDIAALEKELGIPIVGTIASRGQGVQELFQVALETAQKGRTGRTLLLSLDVETALMELIARLDREEWDGLRIPKRLMALKLLERVDLYERKVSKIQPELLEEVKHLREEITTRHGRPSDVVLSSERHSLAVHIFERVARVRARQSRPFRERIDRYVMHPFWGYGILGGILLVLFNMIFNLGRLLEKPLLAWFHDLSLVLARLIPPDSLFGTLAEGLIQGFSGGVAIVLPYLVPFLLGLALLEDVGYLPRAAFLMDSIMHRIGLHGKAVFSFVLGYGCNVPAIMSIRSLESSRDRFISAPLVCMIPCAARTTIIFALAAYYLGPNTALLLYLLNLAVIGASGRLLTRLKPEPTPGMILEIPSYRWPLPGAVINKVWFRLREFIVMAWPLLIIGSMVLSLISYFQLFEIVNRILSPFSEGLLGLPRAVGIPLIFGILRKELSLIMLVQALGTNDFALVMSHQQILVFTIFSIFYIPCMATLAMLRSVIGVRGMLFTLAFTTALATAIALVLRLTFFLMGHLSLL